MSRSPCSSSPRSSDVHSTTIQSSGAFSTPGLPGPPAARVAPAEARAGRPRGPLEAARAGADGERVHVVPGERAERERRGAPRGASRDPPARRIEAAAQAAVGEAGPPEQALLADAQGIEVEVADLRHVGRLREAVDAAVLVDADDQVAAAGAVDVDDRRRVADVEVRDVDQTALVPPLPGARDRIERNHTSELQSQSNLVCRLLLEKKKKKNII